MQAKKYTVAEITAMICKNDTSTFYNSWAWRKLSHDVIRENHNECYLCRKHGKVAAATLVHHVNELKLRPDLAYSRKYIDDHGKVQLQLMPLCFECHEKTHKRGAYQEVSNKFSTPERW
jgi:5-methylcytosine-specific restriction protein A